MKFLPIALVCLAVCSGEMHSEPDSSEPARYTLRYFGVRGLAEGIRLMLQDVGHEAGAEYDEIRYGKGFEDWPTAKRQGTESGLLPFGQVPSLTHHSSIHGEIDLVQSDAIMGYLARRHGLYGERETESAKIDIMIGGIKDLRQKWSSRMPYGATPEMVAQGWPMYLNEDLPDWLEHIDRLKTAYGGRLYMVGSEPSLADFYAFETFDRNLRAGAWEAFEKHPALIEFVKTFANRAGIRKYLESEGAGTPTARIPHAGGPDTEDSPGEGAKYLVEKGILAKSADKSEF